MRHRTIATLLAVLATSAAHAQTEVQDADGDGVFSMDELKTAYPSMTDEIFVLVDVNGDGAVDANELAAAVDAGVLTS